MPESSMLQTLAARLVWRSLNAAHRCGPKAVLQDSDGDPSFCCRSLFEKDKLLFAFGLASGLQVDAGAMNAAELRFLLTGGVAVGGDDRPNPCSTWLSDKSWGEICRASQLLQEVWQVRSPELHVSWGLRECRASSQCCSAVISCEGLLFCRQGILSGQLLLQPMLRHEGHAVCISGLAGSRLVAGVVLVVGCPPKSLPHLTHRHCPAAQLVHCKLTRPALPAQDLPDAVIERPEDWKRFSDSPNPEQQPLPEPWKSVLNPFQRILVLRMLRPDKVVPALTVYVADTLGKRFVEPKPFAIEPSYNDSACSEPLIFVLSAGR